MTLGVSVIFFVLLSDGRWMVMLLLRLLYLDFWMMFLDC